MWSYSPWTVITRLDLYNRAFDVWLLGNSTYDYLKNLLGITLLF